MFDISYTYTESGRTADTKGQLRVSRLKDIFISEHRKITAYVRSLWQGSGAIDAEDIVQDVFLSAYSAERISPIDDTLAYIYRSVSNRVIDMHRKKKNNEISSDREDASGGTIGNTLQDPRSSVEDLFENEELRSILFDALSRLNESEQKIIIENEFESKTFAEMSNETGIPVGTLLSRKSRAVKKLAAILEYDEYCEELLFNGNTEYD